MYIYIYVYIFIIIIITIIIVMIFDVAPFTPIMSKSALQNNHWTDVYRWSR